MSELQVGDSVIYSSFDGVFDRIGIITKIVPIHRPNHGHGYLYFVRETSIDQKVDTESFYGEELIKTHSTTDIDGQIKEMTQI